MLCPQNMSVGPRLPESMVWHVLRRQNMLLLLMMMDDDEGCWMMVMVMVMAVAMVKAMVMVMMVMVMVMVMMVMVMVMVMEMIVDIVGLSMPSGRKLRRSPWRALRRGLRQLCSDQLLSSAIVCFGSSVHQVTPGPQSIFLPKR